MKWLRFLPSKLLGKAGRDAPARSPENLSISEEGAPDTSASERCTPQPNEIQLSASALTPNSNLLFRLPVEIRLQVWKEIVGGNLFHMPPRSQNDSLRCYVCKDFRSDMTSNQAARYPRCQGTQQEPCFFSRPGKIPIRAMSLLLTCRQIYAEAADVLYSTNVFNIDEPFTLETMTRVVGSKTASIRIVHVNYAMWRIRANEHREALKPACGDWIRFWRLLAEGFQGLQYLRLDIYGTSNLGILDQEDLEPLLKLQGLQRFDLAVWRDHSGTRSTSQDLLLVYNSEIFKVCVGPSADTFYIHADILARSRVLEKEVKGLWKESSEREISWESWKPGVADKFFEWLYTGDYHCPYPSEAPGLENPPHSEKDEVMEEKPAYQDNVTEWPEDATDLPFSAPAIPDEWMDFGVRVQGNFAEPGIARKPKISLAQPLPSLQELQWEGCRPLEKVMQAEEFDTWTGHQLWSPDQLDYEVTFLLHAELYVMACH
ncbi:MAG: hypothetical protein Q9220_005570 [cf. Caloplaca sp. 1 TL-2023]